MEKKNYIILRQTAKLKDERNGVEKGLNREWKLSPNVHDKREIFKKYLSTGFLAGEIECKRYRTIELRAVLRRNTRYLE
jgi:hypothetical protein